MRKYGRLAAVLCLCIVFFTGCGAAKVPEIVDTPSVAVDKEGTVTVWQVGVFDHTDYVLSELRDMAAEEAGRFNSASGKSAAVAVEKVEALEDGSGKVVVTYRFDGWESASAFLEEDIFVGAALATAGEGRIDAAGMKSVKDDAPLSEEQLMQDTGSSVLITDIRGNVYCPGKVTYISEGAFVNPDGSVNTSDAEGAVSILYQ